MKPGRTPTNRRQYSDEEIERLTLLRRATEEGHKIGQIADLTVDELMKLLSHRILGPRPTARPDGLKGDHHERTAPVSSHLDELMEAVMGYDRDAFQAILSRAAVAMGRMRLLEEMVIPLIRRVDEMWSRGSLRMAHEHLVSSLLRSFLASMDGSSRLPSGAPILVITTPSGQVHELGALISASAAVMAGWKPVYLGADLPSDEICFAVKTNRASAVALSLVYPTDDPRLRDELHALRKLLPGHVAIIAGGRAVPSYLDALEEIGAKIVTDLRSFCRCLGELCVDRPVQGSSRNLA